MIVETPDLIQTASKNIVAKCVVEALSVGLIQAKNVDETKAFIYAGADVNSKDSSGWTALMYADSVEQTKLLIDAGADVNAKNDYGRTALMVTKSVEQTKLLIEAGADIYAKDIDGETALTLAKTYEQIQLIEDIIDVLSKAAKVIQKGLFGKSDIPSTKEKIILCIPEGSEFEIKFIEKPDVTS